jgi:hypothetical protein
MSATGWAHSHSQLMCTPEMAREMTNRWISLVPLSTVRTYLLTSTAADRPVQELARFAEVLKSSSILRSSQRGPAGPASPRRKSLGAVLGQASRILVRGW